jgi:hypothetical protein
VRLPASFTIGAHGVLSPPLIGAPKHTDIALTVRAGDGKVHVFALETPRAYRVTVSQGHPGHVLLKATPVGTYVIKVDNAPAGKLVIGTAPGP